MSETRFGTFDELLELTSDDMRPIVAALRKKIYEVDPESVEVVRLGDRAATYGVGPKKMKEGYAYILPYSEWVNLGFYQGVSLPDPHEIMEGTGANMRHVKVRDPSDAAAPSITQLLEAAVAERRAVHGR